MTVTYSVEGIDTDLVLDVHRAIKAWANEDDADVESVPMEDADVAIYLDTPVSDVKRRGDGGMRFGEVKDVLDERYDYCNPDHRIINTRGRSQNSIEHMAVNAIISERET